MALLIINHNSTGLHVIRYLSKSSHKCILYDSIRSIQISECIDKGKSIIFNII